MMCCMMLLLICYVFIASLRGGEAATPTFAPTSLPTSTQEAGSKDIPIAMHQLVLVDTAGDAVIRLKSFNLNSNDIKYRVKSVPTTGSAHQLSHVFSLYGYEPKAGEKIAVGSTVSGSNNRIYYKRPSPDVAGVNKWGAFQFEVENAGGYVSYPGTVTLVPPSGAIVGSSFLLSSEAWTVIGNQLTSYAATYEPYSRGALMNHYIIAAEGKVNVQAAGNADQSLWYFDAPTDYHGNHGIAYGGVLQFSIASYSGDFSQLNDEEVNVVILECAECDGPVGKGITLGFSIGTLGASPNGAFTGAPKRISIPLVESGGWLKDPQNSLLTWTTPSKCDMIQVLSRLSSVRILGDWTTWYETIGIDSVQISNKKGQLPVCAMQRPDASICEC